MYARIVAQDLISFCCCQGWYWEGKSRKRSLPEILVSLWRLLFLLRKSFVRGTAISACLCFSLYYNLIAATPAPLLLLEKNKFLLKDLKFLFEKFEFKQSFFPKTRRSGAYPWVSCRRYEVVTRSNTGTYGATYMSRESVSCRVFLKTKILSNERSPDGIRMSFLDGEAFVVIFVSTVVVV